MNLVLLALIVIVALLVLIRHDTINRIRSLGSELRAHIDWLYPVFSPDQVRAFHLEVESRQRRIDRELRRQAEAAPNSTLSEADEHQRLLALLDDDIAFAAHEQALLANYRVVAGQMLPLDAKVAYSKAVWALRSERDAFEFGRSPFPRRNEGHGHSGADVPSVHYLCFTEAQITEAATAERGAWDAVGRALSVEDRADFEAIASLRTALLRRQLECNIAVSTGRMSIADALEEWDQFEADQTMQHERGRRLNE